MADAGGRMTFIIAHRLSTMRHADKILVLDEGKVVGFGPHDELVATCDLYRRMWEAQRLEPRRPESPSPPEPEVVEPPEASDEAEPEGSPD